MALVNDYGPRPGDPGYHQGAPGAVGIAWGINTSDGAVSLDDEYGGRGGGSDGGGSGSGGGTSCTQLSNEFTTGMLQTYVNELLGCAGDPRNIREWGGSAHALFGCTSNFDCDPNDEACSMCSGGGSGGSGGSTTTVNKGDGFRTGSSWSPSNEGTWVGEIGFESPEGDDSNNSPAVPAPTPKPPPKPTPSPTPVQPNQGALQWSQSWGNGWQYQQGSFTGSGGRPTNYSLITGNDYYIYTTWNDVTAQQSSWANWAIVNKREAKPTVGTPGNFF